MKTFTDQEIGLIRKLGKAAALTTLEFRQACPTHSACIPLPLFRVYRSNDDAFDAEWNSHRKGPKQAFLFQEVLGE